MQATLLFRQRVVYSQQAFAELVLWSLPQPAPGSVHAYKYRLAFVDSGICVIRYDNEAKKGDHVHVAGTESRYPFVSVERLVHDFETQIERWIDEHGDP